jgi:hypothetical protein
MREPTLQRLEQPLDFVDARAYLHQIPRVCWPSLSDC